MLHLGIPPRHTRIVQGRGRLAELPAIIQSLELRHVLLVTDPGIVEAGHVEPAKLSLQLKQIDVLVYDQVAENPSTEDVAACAEFVRAKEFPVDGLIGLGGGSSLDTAKGANFLLTNGGDMADYRGDHKTEKPLLPFVAIPTTTGTGSEAQRFAVVSDAKSKLKMACGSPGCAARVAILDPDLVRTQPQRIVAMSGIDALSHAVETWVTKRRNPISRLYSQAAWDCLTAHLPPAFDGEATAEDWEALQWGSCLAGMAIEASMLGAAHAAANPLTARYGILHGQAVGNLLPPVMRFNDEPAGRIAQVETLLEQSGLQIPLSNLGMVEADIPRLAADAMLQWTGQFNPRKVSADRFTDLYRQLL